MSSVDDLLDLKPFSPPRSALEPGLDEPIFSIIVPTRNRPVSLRTALEAIKQQTFSGFEVIVVDDGSRTECRTEYAALQKTLELALPVDQRFSGRFSRQRTGCCAQLRHIAGARRVCRILRR